MKIAMANDHAGTALKNEIKAYLKNEGIAMEIVKTWLATEPLMDEKYRRRVKKVEEINNQYCVPVK
jgi:ribose 5-phosphate isomerase RpiB